MLEARFRAVFDEFAHDLSLKIYENCEEIAAKRSNGSFYKHVPKPVCDSICKGFNISFDEFLYVVSRTLDAKRVKGGVCVPVTNLKIFKRIHIDEDT